MRTNHGNDIQIRKKQTRGMAIRLSIDQQLTEPHLRGTGSEMSNIRRVKTNASRYGYNPANREEKLVSGIDLMVKVGPDVEKLLKTVKQKNFTTDLKLQKDAAVLFRGIDIKMRSLDACAEAKDHGNAEVFIEILDALRNEYSQVFNRIPIDVTSDGKGLTMVLAPASISKPKKSGVS